MPLWMRTLIIHSLWIGTSIISLPHAAAQTAVNSCNSANAVDSTCASGSTWSTNYINNPYHYGPSPGPGTDTGGDGSGGGSGGGGGGANEAPCNTPISITSNTTLQVPASCPHLHVNWAIAGGGSGGNGEQQSRGASGGGGGSGGYADNLDYSLIGGKDLTISVGAGGQQVEGDAYAATNAPQSGGSTSITSDGNILVSLSGGGAGGSGLNGDNSGTGTDMAGAAGAGGAPNGNNGEGGTIGASPTTGRGPTNGGNGASSPQGTGGSGGVPTGNQDGGNASGYGAGGGGGSNADGSTTRFIWFGGAGSPGAVNIQFGQ